MATFAPRLASQQVDRVARLQTMMDMPFTLTRNLGEQAQQGILDSFGLGTVVRDLAIPAGNTAPRVNPGVGAPGPIGPIIAGYEAGRNLLNGMRRDQPSMSEAEYKASPYFRTDIPFEEGMTEDRAAALAMFYDTKKVREYFGQKRPFSTFIGQLAGQALDPINYVPVFGQAAEAAAVARIGTVAGRAVIGSADAAINTAAFGLLTSGLRDQFGDDTSWEAMTSEIAMSALIGGAFGGVSGVISNAVTARRGRIDRQLEAAVADALTDLRAVKETRAVLNEAIGDMAAGRDVALSPNGQAVVERIQTRATNDATTARALDVETASIPDGAKVAITPAGSRVEIRPEVVELDSLVNASGALQVRNRSSQASAAQVEQIATNLDPARLMTSVDADSGAPIVGGDNVVDSGNGRVMALRRAYEAYPDRAGAYRKALESAGYDLTGIRNPVLISRRVTPLSEDARARFNAEANAPRAAQMSAVELAAMDRNALEGTLDILDPSPVTSAANRAFVQRFLGNLVPSARGALVDPSGAINADGVRRIENALVAQAYGDVDVGVLRRFAEATDDNTRSIVGAMSDVAGKWAGMRQAIKRGDISPEFDMTQELTDALRMIGQWREQAAREGRPVSMVIREGMAQLDLLSGEVSPETQAIISAFYTSNSFARAAGRETIAEFLSRVVDAAEELGRPQLFGEAGVGRMEVLRNAAVNEQGNLFTPVGTVDGIEADGGFSRGTEAAADRQGGRSGIGQGGRVADTVSQRFAAAGRPEAEARALGQIVDAFYAQQAARLGITVDEFVDRFGIPEVRQGDAKPDAAMAQGPDSPAFREWFGDSKVVDENGEPLVVYHGSPNKGIEAFDPDRLNDKTRGTGFWFTTEDKAGTYSGEAGEVYPAYLKLERPIVVAWDAHWADGPAAAHQEYRIKDASGAEVLGRGYFEDRALAERAIAQSGRDDLEIETTDVSGEQTTDEWVRRLRRANPDADGIILRNVAGGGEFSGGFAGWVEGDEFIAFSPTQIKSVNNRGTFDPNDPRILFQPAYHGTPHLFDKFSTDHIGSGEGVQAFGWGLYFAGNREVSEYYRNTLTKDYVEPAKRALEKSAGDIDAAIASAKAEIARLNALELAPESGADMRVTKVAAQEAIIHELDAYKKAGNWRSGRLFEVDIPTDDELLVWDKPIAEQTGSVKSALVGLGFKELAPPPVPSRDLISDMTVRTLVRDALKQDDAPENIGLMIDNDGGLYRRAMDFAKRQGLDDDALDDMGGVGAFIERQAKPYIDALIERERIIKENELTGAQIYAALEARFDGDPKRASQALLDAGVPGLRYLDGGSRSDGDGSYNYVIFDDSRVSVTRFEQDARGAIQLGDTDIITLFETADASTALHETGHLFLSMLKGIGEAADAPAEVRADWDAVRGWWGENADAVAADANASGRAEDVTADDVRAALATGSSGDAVKDRAIDVGMQEQWARGFEAYVREGKTPSSALARAFDQFKQWLQAIYRRAADLNVNLSPEIRQVFDNLLAEPKPRAEIMIDGMPVRVSDPNAPAAVEPPTAQKSLMLNEPDDAAARVGKDETLRDIALSHGVDPATGGFVEMGDIAQMREEGRLTEADEAVLASADQMYADSEAYGRALEAAVACLV